MKRKKYLCMRWLEPAFSAEKMRLESLGKMTAIAGRELNIDAGKKIRCQTVHEMRQERTLYRTDVLFQPQFEAMHIHIDRDTFIELQYRNFMPVRRNGNRRKTTLSNHRMHRCPYLTVDYTPVSPNRLRTGDITYIKAEDGHGCLSFITDACSHKAAGWNRSLMLRPSGAPAALKRALSSLKGMHPELIRHSDRGSQYCSRDYIHHSKRRSIQISMTEGGNPRENAITERINGILKTEWIYGCKPDSRREAVASADRITDLYNSQRPHQSTGYMIPAPAHQTSLKTEYKWENYYRNASVPVEKKTGKSGSKSSEPNRV
jgi:transposase InsO family protein